MPSWALELHQKARRAPHRAIGRQLPGLSTDGNKPVDLANVDVLAGAKDAGAAKLDAVGTTGRAGRESSAL